jgi:tripartite-type tricarboxylate transporter receptor subunit TctC
MAELGRPEVDVDLWFGIVAPPGTDAAIVRTLNEMFLKATNDPELTERFTQLGVEIATGTPEEFKKAISSDNARLGPFVKELTAKAN